MAIGLRAGSRLPVGADANCPTTCPTRQTLRSLERDGLVHRQVLPGSPAPVEYRLTDLGASLLEPLNAVRAWSRQHIDDVDDARRAYDERRS